MKKGRLAAALAKQCGADWRPRSLEAYAASALLLHRARILALGLDVAVDELDHADRRRIAVAEAGLEDAGIAALALRVARAEHVEELLDDRLVLELRDRLAAGMQVAALAERHQLLDDRTQVLRLGQGGDDLLMLDERGRHVLEHRLAVLGRAVELAMSLAVTHCPVPSSGWERDAPAGQ